MKRLNIEIKKEPFTHVILHDVYEKHEYEGVWSELLFLQKRMVPGYMTGAAGDSLGITKKRNAGIFLNDVYRNPEFSSIMVCARNTIADPHLKHIIDGIDDTYFDLYDSINSDSTIVQSYANGDFYKPHRDECIFTSICCLYKKPKAFSGGLLHFPKYDFFIDLEDNQCVIFPSRIEHGVTEIKTNESNPEYNRFSISNFMKIV
jgi:hypothetical protein